MPFHTLTYLHRLRKGQSEMQWLPHLFILFYTRDWSRTAKMGFLVVTCPLTQLETKLSWDRATESSLWFPNSRLPSVRLLRRQLKGTEWKAVWVATAHWRDHSHGWNYSPSPFPISTYKCGVHLRRSSTPRWSTSSEWRFCGLGSLVFDLRPYHSEPRYY